MKGPNSCCCREENHLATPRTANKNIKKWGVEYGEQKFSLLRAYEWGMKEHASAQETYTLPTFKFFEGKI